MRSLPTPGHSPPTRLSAVRSDTSIRDSVRVLTEVVTQLSERIELLEARELLSRPR
jgi:hypothetical protein